MLRMLSVLLLGWVSLQAGAALAGHTNPDIDYDVPNHRPGNYGSGDCWRNLTRIQCLTTWEDANGQQEYFNHGIYAQVIDSQNLYPTASQTAVDGWDQVVSGLLNMKKSGTPYGSENYPIKLLYNQVDRGGMDLGGANDCHHEIRDPLYTCIVAVTWDHLNTGVWTNVANAPVDKFFADAEVYLNPNAFDEVHPTNAELAGYLNYPSLQTVDLNKRAHTIAHG